MVSTYRLSVYWSTFSHIGIGCIVADRTNSEFLNFDKKLHVMYARTYIPLHNFLFGPVNSI